MYTFQKFTYLFYCIHLLIILKLSTMENPFEIIFEKLERIEEQLKNIRDNQHLTFSPQIMTIEQVASYLSLSKATIYGYTFRNTIPYAKRGKRLYFEKSAIDEWLFENSRETTKDIEKMASEYIYKNPIRF